jgi:hypothetical protein
VEAYPPTPENAAEAAVRLQAAARLAEHVAAGAEHPVELVEQATTLAAQGVERLHRRSVPLRLVS